MYNINLYNYRRLFFLIFLDGVVYRMSFIWNLRSVTSSLEILKGRGKRLEYNKFFDYVFLVIIRCYEIGYLSVRYFVVGFNKKLFLLIDRGWVGSIEFG